METVTFQVDPYGTPATRTLPLASWDVKIRYVRARYNYVNGGTDSYWKPGNLILFALEWDHLNAQQLADLNYIMDAIRDNSREVRLVSLAGTTYNYLIDVEDNEELTDTGRTFKMFGRSVTFVTKEAT